MAPHPTLTQAGHSLGGAPSGKAVPVIGKEEPFLASDTSFPQPLPASSTAPGPSVVRVLAQNGLAQAQGASPWGSLSLPSGKQLTMPSFKGGGGGGSTGGW